MPNSPRTETDAARQLLNQDSLAQLWSQVFSETGTLSGFCLEWLLDKAEFSEGRNT